VARTQIFAGAAGEKAVTINNLGYRRSESWVTPIEPGKNAYLTIDLRIQAAAETAFRTHAGFTGRGAVVVMDVWSGDVLAMSSWPTFDPNWLAKKEFPPGAYSRWEDKDLAIRINRAAYAQYQPGSVIKTLVALAALETPEARFNPNDIYHVVPGPDGVHGIYIGRGFKVRDTVHAGDYTLRRAISQSSNAYFVSLGLRPGVFDKVIELAEELHFGQKLGLGLMQEYRGIFPPREKLRNDGDKANVCIGGGELSITPCQVAVLISAIANGGKVLQPRLIDRLESQDPLAPETTIIAPKGETRGQLNVSKRSFEILREAMLDETESDEGTGKRVVGCGFRVCGKTGTAERNERIPGENRKKNTTWFASFAPYESPRYAVVVAVENGISGGTSCVPIARDVYLALKAIDAEYTSKNLNVVKR
jgi:cell division protein FtsI/penicillin-binding protein 2